jgi:hypothetical protein
MRRSLTLVAVATVLLAGCGEDEQDVGAPRLSKAEFAERGARICREGAKQTVEDVERELAKPEHRDLDENERQFVAYKAGTGATRRALDRLGDLRPPKEIEPRVESMLKGIDEVFDILNELRGASRAEAARLAQRMQELARSTRSDARAAGLEACLPENT